MVKLDCRITGRGGIGGGEFGLCGGLIPPRYSGLVPAFPLPVAPSPPLSPPGIAIGLELTVERPQRPNEGVLCLTLVCTLAGMGENGRIVTKD